MPTRRSLLAAPALFPFAARAQAPGVQQDDVVGPGLRRNLLIRWGDRVAFDAPAFDPRRPSAEAAAAQFGWDARVAGFVPSPTAADGSPRGLLAVVHPEVPPRLAFPGGVDLPEVAGMTQGASVLNLERQAGRWIVVEGGFQSRRLTAATLCRATGPLAAEAGGALRGVLALTGGAATPWGSILLTEGDAAPWLARLGGRDAAGFGWTVELDPADPQAIPAKRTALGRFPKADAAAALTADRRPVVFLAEAGGTLFRFVSAGDGLDAGTLAVARNQGGRVSWIPLPDARDPLGAARAAGATGFAALAALEWDAPRGRLLMATAEGVLELRGDPAGEAGVLVLLGRVGPGRAEAVAAEAGGAVLAGTGSGGRAGALAETLWRIEGGSATPLYGAPRGASIGGAAVAPDGTILFAARHPGAEPGASFERPSTRWPQFEPGVPPRTSLVALSR